MHNFRRNGRRERESYPLNRQFQTVVGSADVAEMTQVQRMARLMPPPEICYYRLAGARE